MRICHTRCCWLWHEWSPPRLSCSLMEVRAQTQTPLRTRSTAEIWSPAGPVPFHDCQFLITENLLQVCSPLSSVPTDPGKNIFLRLNARWRSRQAKMLRRVRTPTLWKMYGSCWSSLSKIFSRVSIEICLRRSLLSLLEVSSFCFLTLPAGRHVGQNVTGN